MTFWTLFDSFRMDASFLAWGIVALGLALPVSIAGASAVFFPLLGVWLLSARWSWRLNGAQWGKAETALMGFISVSLLSTLVGMDLRHSVREMWRKDFYFLMMVLVMALVRNREMLRRTLKAFLLSSGAAAALGVLQLILGFNQQDSHGLGDVYVWPERYHFLPRALFNLLSRVDGRAIGPRSHPLTFAEGLLFAWGFLVCFLMIDRRGGWWRWLSGLWLVGLALLASQSRMAWLALIPITCASLLATELRVGVTRLAILAFPCVALLWTPLFKDRARSMIDLGQHSASERLHMWRAAKAIAREKPWLGVGPGNVTVATLPFQNAAEHADGPWGHLHSTYFNFLAERGGLGLCTYVLFLGVLGWELVAGFRRVKGFLRAVILGSGLGLIGFLISGITETTYNASVISMTLYFVLGIGLAVSRHPERFSENV